MDSSKAIISMIEHRQRELPWLAEVVRRDTKYPEEQGAEVIRTPEFLAYLVEMEMQTLIAAGASSKRAIQVLAESLQVWQTPEDDTALIARLWEQNFPEAARDLLAILDDVRAIARASLKPPTFAWPPQEWLSGEVTREQLNDQLRGQLDRRQIFPRSVREAELQHFRIMSRLGGRIFGFSSPPDTWRFMIGRGGYALVQDGKSLAFIETIMN